MASQATIANSASFQQDSALVARYAAARRERGLSVSSQASQSSISEEDTAPSTAYGSGATTPVPKARPIAIESTPSKPQKYSQEEGVTVPVTERDPLLPRRSSTEANGHWYRGEEEQETE